MYKIEQFQCQNTLEIERLLNGFKELGFDIISCDIKDSKRMVDNRYDVLVVLVNNEK